MSVINLVLTQSACDATYVELGYVFDIEGSDLILGYGAWGDRHAHIPLVFPAVAIPAGSTVTSATLTLQCKTGNANPNILAEILPEIGNAELLTTEENFLARTFGSGTILFWETAIVSGTDYPIDVTDAVNQIINGVGWASGNNLGLHIMDGSVDVNNIRFKSWDYSTAGSPRLSVTYTVPVVVVTPEDSAGGNDLLEIIGTLL